MMPATEPPAGDPSAAPSGPDGKTAVIHLTAAQRRRFRVGLGAVALIVWSLGVVRLVVTGRVTASSGALGLVGLALALGAAAAAAGRVLPVVVADGAGIRARWAFRRLAVPWSAVTEISVRERGMARRVVLHHDGRRSVLPVPLTGGSILSPGVDPALDEKVALLCQWWQGHSAP